MMNSGTGRYPRFFFEGRPTNLLIILGGSALAILIYIVYSAISNDTAPDSILGYSYATLGTIFMILATVSYTKFRQSRKRGVGDLNRSLHWHVCFGILALVLIFLHSFGNFNPRSGTYALYAMIALVLSGIIGRMLDRILPRMIAQEASRALTEGGDDRVAAVMQTMQDIANYNTQQPSSRATRQARPAQAGARRGNGALPTSWDLAYISLDETPQEVERDSAQYRFVPDRRSTLADPSALMPGLNERMDELQNVQKAFEREQFYRAIIRYWRVFHVALVILTFALTLWHLEFASTLLIPVFFH